MRVSNDENKLSIFQQNRMFCLNGRFGRDVEIYWKNFAAKIKNNRTTDPRCFYTLLLVSCQWFIVVCAPGTVTFAQCDVVHGKFVVV